MEKAFKVFVIVMVIVLVGWIIYTFTSTANKSAELQKKAEDAFSNAWNGEK